MRESLFNILAHGSRGFRAGRRASVIDLFAGTGALGLEAISRGAAFCLFVEQEADARALIRHNIEAFGLTGVTRIFRRDATDLGPGRHACAPFHAGLPRPALRKGLGERGAHASAARQMARTGRDRGAGGARRAPRSRCRRRSQELDRRTYGDTQILFARYAA